MHISARNQYHGTVKHLSLGQVNAEVVIECASGVEIAAVITRESAQRMELAVGKPAHAVIKASDVMVGVCCDKETCDCRKARSSG